MQTFRISNGENIAEVSADGKLSFGLPPDAATGAKQDITNGYLTSIDTKLPSGLTVTSSRLLVDGSGVTQPISVGSLPLPSGAATAALQTSILNELQLKADLTETQPVRLPDGASQTVSQLITQAGDELILETRGAGACSFIIVGAWSGLAAAYATADGTNWQNIPLINLYDTSQQTYAGDNSLCQFSCGGFYKVKIRFIVLGSGTPIIYAWLNQANYYAPVTSFNHALLKNTSKIANSGGTVVNPATEETLDAASSKSFDLNNTSTTPLGSNATFTGTATDTTKYDNVSVMVYSNVASATDGLVLEFSGDGTNWDTNDTYSVSANSGDTVSASLPARYFRVKYTNGPVAQSSFRLYTTLHRGNIKPSSHRISDTLDSQNDVIVVKSVLAGQTDSGEYQNIPATSEGHLEVAIHEPLLPFGSLHTESLYSIFQFDAVYNINDQLVQTRTSGSGTVSVANSMFNISTGTTIYSYGTLLSRKRLRYRPGQGTLCRFTALFPTPTANSINVAGPGHAEDGYFFATYNTEFGILKSSGGTREVRTLTISTASTTNENVTVTLNGTAYTVAVTNSGNTLRTAYEISRGSFGPWECDVVGSTVRFIHGSVGAKSGTYSLTATTAVGSFATTRAGSANTDTFIPQSQFNADKLDGTGLSGFTIDPTKLNIYEIDMAYLGGGAVDFKVMFAPENSNNVTWVKCHCIKNPGTLTQPHVGNPSFPFTAAAYSAGSTTDLTVKIASVMGAIEGKKQLHGNRFTYVNQLTTVGSTNIQALFTIKNDRFYAGRTNQCIVNILSVSGAIKHTSPVIYYLIRNGTLTGNPNFQPQSTFSITTYDTAATTVSYSTGDQLLWTGHLGDTGELDHHFTPNGELEEITLQPGEWVTLGAKATTGTPSWVTGSINTREDQ